MDVPQLVPVPPNNRRSRSVSATRSRSMCLFIVFCYKFCYKLCVGRESRVHPLTPKVHYRDFGNVNSNPPKSSEYGFFCYISASKWPILLKHFLRNLVWSAPWCQISSSWLSKCWFTDPKIAKIGNFWYIIAPMGYIRFSDFYNIWHGERIPGPHSYV